MAIAISVYDDTQNAIGEFGLSVAVESTSHPSGQKLSWPKFEFAARRHHAKLPPQIGVLYWIAGPRNARSLTLLKDEQSFYQAIDDYAPVIWQWLQGRLEGTDQAYLFGVMRALPGRVVLTPVRPGICPFVPMPGEPRRISEAPVPGSSSLAVQPFGHIDQSVQQRLFPGASTTAPRGQRPLIHTRGNDALQHDDARSQDMTPITPRQLTATADGDKPLPKEISAPMSVEQDAAYPRHFEQSTAVFQGRNDAIIQRGGSHTPAQPVSNVPMLLAPAPLIPQDPFVALNTNLAVNGQPYYFAPLDLQSDPFPEWEPTANYAGTQGGSSTQEGLGATLPLHGMRSPPSSPHYLFATATQPDRAEAAIRAGRSASGPVGHGTGQRIQNKLARFASASPPSPTPVRHGAGATEDVRPDAEMEDIRDEELKSQE